MNIEQALSPERLLKYDTWASGDRDTALRLYALNLSISEAFYIPLHMLEITLRNAIHHRMSELHGPLWFQNSAVIHARKQQDNIASAVQKLGTAATPSQIVAEVTFGFWTGMFDQKNHTLWGQDLRPIFNLAIQRKTVSSRLYEIRSLRNRIAHHESIIQLDLPKTYIEICEILGWLSTEALTWTHQHCRFSATHPQTPIIIGNLVNPALRL
jgi:abortive infection bacteriophage resistance protein